MSKVRAEELLEAVKEQLKDAREKAKLSTDRVEMLKCAKAYLEFIITGLKRNPSMKAELEDE